MYRHGTPARWSAKLFHAVWASLFVIATAGAQTLSDDNIVYKDKIDGVTAINVAALANGLITPPPADKGFEALEYSSNIGLKFMPGVIEPPPDVAVPRTNTCNYVFHRPEDFEAVINYDNVYGVELGIPSDWGILDDAEVDDGDTAAPEIYHFNTGSWLTLRRNFVDVFGNVQRDERGNPVQEILFTNTNSRGDVLRQVHGEEILEVLPIGIHTIEWELENKLDAIFDVLLDPVIFFAELKHAAKSKALVKKQKRMGRVWDDAAIKWAKSLEWSLGRQLGQKITKKLGLLGIELVVNEVDSADITEIPTGVFNRRYQQIYVLDPTPPEISVTQQPGPFEATTLGGELARRHFDELRELLVYSDECDRPVTLEAEPIGTRFWPLGQTTTMQWCATDPGPTSVRGGRNRACTDIHVRVEDTLPPLLLPPASKTVIANSAQALNIGTPGVFDLADPDVIVTSNAPVTFPVGRTQVTWTATDSSGNSTSKAQWISIKESNTPPVALAQSGIPAVSFEETRIELQASDVDVLDGRRDQLAFRIQDPPDNGFFVAPLFPFFIEDHRTHRINPDGTYSSFSSEWQDFCENGSGTPRDAPTDVLLDPTYINVTDDGTVYALDKYHTCSEGNGAFFTHYRLSKWVPDENGALSFSGKEYYVGQNRPAPRNLHLFIDHEEQIWWISEAGMRIRTLNRDLEEVADYHFNNFTEINVSTGNRQTAFGGGAQTVQAVVVDKNDIIYLTDGTKLLAYDLRQQITNDPGYFFPYYKPVGQLAWNPGGSTTDAEPFKSWSSFLGGGYADMRIDSEGSIYVSDSPTSRIFKWTGVQLSEDRQTIEKPAEFVGWLGACETNLDPNVFACDVDLKRSVGFSCEDDLCGGTGWGTGRGQFNQQTGIAMSPTDVLYVSDVRNDRVQRFTTDGFFGGEAVSECGGSCFVLGDFGQVHNISVNSNFFYLLDPQAQVTHIFETTPITDIDDQTMEETQSAFVTYQSNNNFVGTDIFSFVVNDGLDESAAASISVDVTRNFRAPIAQAGIHVTTEEDTAVELPLNGLDADDDALEYRIVTEPNHGTISESAGVFTYTPDANYYGPDEFEYLASDAPTSAPAMESAPERVTLDVTAVNDVPVLTVDAKTEAGGGYPYRLEVTIDDPDPDDFHRVAIHWGDGGIMRSDHEELIVANSAKGGVVVTEYVISESAGRTLENLVCASDAPSTAAMDCLSADVNAVQNFSFTTERMVDLVVDIADSQPKVEDPNVPDLQRSEPALDGVDAVTYTVTVFNKPPRDESDPEATGVTLDIDVPDEMVLVSHASSRGACSVDVARVSCPLGVMAALDEATVDVTMVGNGKQLADEIATVNAVVTANEKDPGGEDNAASYQTDIAYNPDLDADGDGVPNNADAFPGDPNESVDFDGDGIGDNADTDDDGDFLPDVWERRFGFDDRNASDAALDGDGDGLANVDEFMSGTRPDAADSDLDGAPDGGDNCPARFNLNQYDSDGNGTGDTCDRHAFAGVAAIGDIDGNGFNDFVLVQSDGGRIHAFIKDSENDYSVGADRMNLGGTADVVAHGIIPVPGALPAGGGFALLATDNAGQPHLSVFDSVGGDTLYSLLMFNRNSEVAGFTAAGGEILVAANNWVTGEVAVDRRSADDGLALGKYTVGDQVALIAIADLGTSFATLASRSTNGDLVFNVFDKTTGQDSIDLTYPGADLLKVDMVSLGDAVAVMTEDMDGVSGIRLIDAAGTAADILFEPFGAGWTLTEMRWLEAENLLSVAAVSDTDGIRIATFDPADGSLVSEQQFQASSMSARGITSAATSASASEIGSLASDSGGNVSLEIKNASDGANTRTLLAISASPPPPPPPPPPPGPGNNRGGGGGGAGWLFLAGLLLVAQRRRHGCCVPAAAAILLASGPNER